MYKQFDVILKNKNIFSVTNDVLKHSGRRVHDYQISI